jgi:hypothetical protein
MIDNATILRLDTPQPAGPAGDVSYTTGSAVAARCCQDEPTNAAKYVLGVVVADATSVLFVGMTEAAGLAFNPLDRVTVQLDGETAKLYQVVYRRDRISPGLSHYEVYLKGL